MSARFFEVARPFLAAGLLTPADVHAVALVAPRFGEDDPVRMLGLAFAANAPRLGHAGVDLAQLAARIDAERVTFARPGAATTAAGEADEDAEGATLAWPEPKAWHAATLGSPMVGAVHAAGALESGAPAMRPFVAQPLAGGTLLLTQRMYDEQVRVARAVRARAALAVPSEARLGAPESLDARIAQLFPDEPEGEAARAVRLAATQRLSIVIGGPGTGKTFSITRLLAALLSGTQRAQPLVIRLAAPTGKAAVRMREAIREATAEGARPPLFVEPQVRAALQGLEASTLHRLLGVRPDGTSRHGPDNPIPADVVVVDEVSMVDLVLVRRLLEAVHPDARLILLGDRDQLASVEAGSVLADLVGDGTRGALAANVQAFTRSRRFASAPDVAIVAACLQSYTTSMEGVPRAPDERLARAVEVMTGRAHAKAEVHADARVTWLGPPDVTTGRAARPTGDQLARLVEPYTEGFDELLEDGSRRFFEGYACLLRRHRLSNGMYADVVLEPSFQRRLLRALDGHRVLAVHRRGPLGVAGLDHALSERVRAFLSADGPRDARWHWIGRPILVTENAYDVGLMNGDVGLVLPTPKGLAAVFPHEQADRVRAVALSRLPPHEGALAMTVHKSQGSQFDRVSLVLAGRPSPIETRELIYTGVTRAKNQLAWLGREGELADALATQVTRASGLEALVRGD